MKCNVTVAEVTWKANYMQNIWKMQKRWRVETVIIVTLVCVLRLVQLNHNLSACSVKWKHRDCCCLIVHLTVLSHFFCLCFFQDIGLGSIERCKGFTAHLMQMLVRQRRSLTALTEQWILLRYFPSSNVYMLARSFDRKQISSRKMENKTEENNNFFLCFPVFLFPWVKPS